MAAAVKILPGAPKTHIQKVDVTKIDQVEAAFMATVASLGKGE